LRWLKFEPELHMLNGRLRLPPDAITGAADVARPPVCAARRPACCAVLDGDRKSIVTLRVRDGALSRGLPDGEVDRVLPRGAGPFEGETYGTSSGASRGLACVCVRAACMVR
jgi:hypothetical protein